MDRDGQGLCPWDFPGKNTAASFHLLLPNSGIFLTQGSITTEPIYLPSFLPAFPASIALLFKEQYLAFLLVHIYYGKNYLNFHIFVNDFFLFILKAFILTLKPQSNGYFIQHFMICLLTFKILVEKIDKFFCFCFKVALFSQFVKIFFLSCFSVTFTFLLSINQYSFIPFYNHRLSLIYALLSSTAVNIFSNFLFKIFFWYILHSLSSLSEIP